MFDNEHLARMIEWLDEERRRDKAVIATLEERLLQQTEVMQTLQRRLVGLESDQASIQSSALPAQREAEIVDTVRREMNQLVDRPTPDASPLNANWNAACPSSMSRPKSSFGRWKIASNNFAAAPAASTSCAMWASEPLIMSRRYNRW
ncbi:hypothetical protein HC776_00155 [bacterium]|nr:hypothetical protein [bacterium]